MWPDSVVADAPRLHGAGIEHADWQPVIYHHIAALADVLAHANPALGPDMREPPKRQSVGRGSRRRLHGRPAAVARA
ncbi:hypothetical protein [Streptomyces sp. C10-9-1]|uniref:hypothetical protein n=1 Tax=Streptomyces sp. C10-9-1 TaxID=1859285 RepID=UPI003D70E58D